MATDAGKKTDQKHPPAFSEIDHAADYALKIRGDDLGELLRNAARGLYSLIGAEGEKRRTRQPVEKQFALDAPDAECLLVEWLSELAYWAESELFIGDDITIEEVNGEHLTATVSGWKASGIDKHVKAVTYHNLKIRRTGYGLEATVIFDV